MSSSDECDSINKTVIDMSSYPGRQIPVGKSKELSYDSGEDFLTEKPKPKKKLKTSVVKPPEKPSPLVKPNGNTSSSLKPPSAMDNNKKSAIKLKPKFGPKQKESQYVPSFATSLASQNTTARSLQDIRHLIVHSEKEPNLL